MSPRTMKEIYDQCISTAKQSPPTTVQSGKLYKWKGNLTSFVMGGLEFRCVPYFGIVFSDSSASIACIPVDPVTNVMKVLKICNNTILLNEPEFVVEVFVINDQEYSLVHLLLDPNKLRVIEKSIRMVTSGLKSTKNCTSLEEQSLVSQHWCQRITPLKISSILLTPRSEVACLVLAIFVNSDENAEEVSGDLMWLVLKNSQVIWKDLLIQNRIYSVNIPMDVPKDYFSRRGTLYSFFDSSWDLSFQQMLHHKDLIKTTACVFLPKKSKIHICSMTPVMTPHSEDWINFSDTRLKTENFASIYGVIKQIRYLEAWKSMHCSWCSKFDKILEQTIQDSDSNEENQIENDENIFKNKWSHCMSTIKCPLEADACQFPEIEFCKTEGDKIEGFGIRGGKLTLQVTLQNNYTDQVSYVFFKRWISSQYPAGLIPGITVCFTDVNVQKSKKQCLYFITTPLTRVLHLESNDPQTFLAPELWGKFGFPFVRNTSQKMWGILDLDLLTKVSITARCKLCNELFEQYQCSNALCKNSLLQMKSEEYNVVAVARLFVRGFIGCETSSLFLKNGNVQKYLGLPERIWQKLCALSALSELLYLHQENDILEDQADMTNLFFRRYCKYFRPKTRFHVCCRPFKSSENRFFCIELSEITTVRLSATRSAIENKTNAKDTG